ncbi:MAG: hypothetical protein ACTSRA_12300 [Promethearchaeota archaeon]
MPIKQFDEEEKTELQHDVERLAHLASLVASFSKDLHQQMEICKNKHGIDKVTQALECSEQDLQDLCDSCKANVKKVTGEDLHKVTLIGAVVKEK